MYLSSYHIWDWRRYIHSVRRHPGTGTHSECRQVSVMTGVAQKDMPKGTVLKVQGHHHSIEGLVPELWELKDAGNAAPFYLLMVQHCWRM